MKNDPTRFSKATLATYIEDRVTMLVREHGIDEKNGYAQCVNKSHAFVRAYGSYCALRDIWLEFDLVRAAGRKQP